MSVVPGMHPHVVVQRLHDDARIPERATPGSVGYDLTSCEKSVTIARGTRRLVNTGIRIGMSNSLEGTDGAAAAAAVEFYARIAPRSGLAVRGIDVLAGVCDSDYRGAYRVLLANNSDEDFVVAAGDRIAQLVFEAVVHPVIHVADSTEAFDSMAPPSVRGEGGFGSTNT
jgi:dUTP pyrophosphatase